MCGIAGIVGRRSPERLAAMMDAMAHRGPDDRGQEWVEAGGGTAIGLGNLRLAILDLSAAGHQPMRVDGHVLAYNGEVFNFQSLRNELEAAGERFFSTTDTEVVLRLLRSKGEGALGNLNGMFGLASWSEADQELLLVRDRFGIKPLYYANHEGELLFASEAKALFAAGVPARLNLAALPAYLSFGWVPGTVTMFEGVHEVPPGHLLRWSERGVSVEEYRDARPAVDQAMDREDAASELRARLEDAVRRQMIADVPVGVLLSGGLDSSAITALAVATSKKTVNAYSITFRPEDARLEQNGADADFARLVSHRLGIELQEFMVDPDATDLMSDVVWHLDEPVADPAGILTLMISRAASRDVTVLLSGQGSDELFGGYRVHLYDRFAQPLSRLPSPWLRAARKGAGVIPRIAPKIKHRSAGLALAAHRSVDMILASAGLEQARRYASFRSAPYFGPESLGRTLGPGVREELLRIDPMEWHMKVFAELPEADFFDRMLYVDFKTFLANQNLVYSDRLSMAASIEMRVPFLDDEVADLALKIPSRLKVRRMRGKSVLRDALQGVVPQEVIDRRKAGFGAPIRSWLRNELREMFDEVVLKSPLVTDGVFREDAIRELVAEHAAADRDHTYRLWSLLALCMWQRSHGVELG